jgi:hypothetical protein
MRWLLTTVFGSRPDGTLFWAASAAFSADRLEGFLSSIVYPIAGSPSAYGPIHALLPMLARGP